MQARLSNLWISMILHLEKRERERERKEEKINTLAENKWSERNVLKLGHGYIFFPYVPRSIDVGDRYLADKCPSKKKRKKKERRKVGVSINRSRSWFYFTDIHNRLNKSRKYYLLKIARNNPSTVSYSFSCCATQRFLNGMAVGFVQLIFLSFFFFFFFQ